MSARAAVHGWLLQVSEMFPVIAVTNAAYLNLTDAINLRQRSLGGRSLPDFDHLFFGQSSATVADAEGVPSGFHHVVHIISVSSMGEVFGIYALPVVACVSEDQSGRDRPDQSLINKPMSKSVPAVAACRPVSPSGAVVPQPTNIRVVRRSADFMVNVALIRTSHMPPLCGHEGRGAHKTLLTKNHTATITDVRWACNNPPAGVYV